MEKLSNNYRVKGLIKSLENSIAEYENDNIDNKHSFITGEIHGMKLALSMVKGWLIDDEED